MLDDKEPAFNSRKERDAFHGATMKTVVKCTKYKSKLPVKVDLFTDRINHLIATGKVKVYYSLKAFYDRRKV
jgi:hypothetical protein